MTVTDSRFAAELITSTGKIFVFDDLHCLKEYCAEQPDKMKEARFYVVDFASGDLLHSNEAHFVKSDQAHSPMGSNTIAFKSATEQQQYLQSHSGQSVSWASVIP